MTAKQAKDIATTAAKWAAVVFPALAGATAIAKAVGATKVDVGRYESDSLARDYRELVREAQQAARDARQIARDSMLANIDRRTREMYCAGKPPGCR